MVKGLAVIGESGSRLIGTPISVSKETKELEQRMFAKAKESDEGVLLLDSCLAVYKIVEDLCILMYAPIKENEIALYNALDAFYSAVLKVVKGSLTEKSLLRHYDEVFLVLDAFIYKGVILSDSATDLASQVPRRTFEGLEAVQIPSKFSSALKKAQKSFAGSWFKK